MVLSTTQQRVTVVVVVVAVLQLLTVIATDLKVETPAPMPVAAGAVLAPKETTRDYTGGAGGGSMNKSSEAKARVPITQPKTVVMDYLGREVLEEVATTTSSLTPVRSAEKGDRKRPNADWPQ